MKSLDAMMKRMIDGQVCSLYNHSKDCIFALTCQPPAGLSIIQRRPDLPLVGGIIGYGGRTTNILPTILTRTLMEVELFLNFEYHYISITHAKKLSHSFRGGLISAFTSLHVWYHVL